jgi:hypothetical protein
VIVARLAVWVQRGARGRKGALTQAMLSRVVLLLLLLHLQTQALRVVRAWDVCSPRPWRAWTSCTALRAEAAWLGWRVASGDSCDSCDSSRQMRLLPWPASQAEAEEIKIAVLSAKEVRGSSCRYVQACACVLCTHAGAVGRRPAPP